LIKKEAGKKTRNLYRKGGRRKKDDRFEGKDSKKEKRL